MKMIPLALLKVPKTEEAAAPVLLFRIRTRVWEFVLCKNVLSVEIRAKSVVATLLIVPTLMLFVTDTAVPAAVNECAPVQVGAIDWLSAGAASERM
jgi:hypothetical protein